MMATEAEHAWDAAHASNRIKAYEKLVRTKGLLEAYEAVFHSTGGTFDSKGTIQIRVHRFRVRASLRVEVSNVGEDGPGEVTRRFLNPVDWKQLPVRVEDSMFWQLPSQHSASSHGFNGDSWTIEGYREGRFHFVHRTTWSLLDGIGGEVFHLGKCIGQLAGLNRFNGNEN